MVCELIVSGSDSAVFLIFSDTLFDTATQAVDIFVILVLYFAVGFWRDDDFQACVFGLATQRIAVISFIGNQRGGAAGDGLIRQKGRALMIAGLAAGQPDAP